MFFWTNIALALFSCGFYWIDPHAMVAVVIAYFLLNILHQILSPLHWSLMADVDDYGKWKTGKRITGMSFSGNLFFLKVGLTVGGAIVGFLLSVYGYYTGAKQQSSSVVNDIMLLFSVIPGIGYLITAGVVRLLRVDRTLMRTIQADLALRHANFRDLSAPAAPARDDSTRRAQMSWPNPFITQRAAPFILRHGAGYYSIASVPQYDRLEIRYAEMLNGLIDAAAVTRLAQARERSIQ